MKNITILLLIFLPIIFIYSQEVSKEEKQYWYEDYDEFLNIVENINPQLEARKLITGEDILDNLKNKKREIDSLKTFEEFYTFFYFTLSALNDAHAAMCQTFEHIKNRGLDSVSFQKAIEVSEKYGFPPKNKYSEKYFPIYLDYVCGEYVLATDFQFINKVDSTDTLLLPAGSIIKMINKRDIDSYIANVDSDFKWDNKNKKKYTNIIGSLYENVKVDKPVFITYVNKNNIVKEFMYNSEKCECKIYEPDYFYLDRVSKKVEYFDNEKILYIRTPMMDDSMFYLCEIYQKAKDKEINKVIWDIRRNPGGICEVWTDILRILIKDTINYTFTLAFLDTDLAYKKVSKYGKLEQLPYLEKNYKVKNIEMVLNPYNLSLNYTGPIYILQDHMIYSAAGALSTLAHKIDQLKTVGVSTGCLLGFGLSPALFQLKNTHLCFQMEPVMDVTDIKEPYDYFHDNIDIPVELSREDWARYWQTDNETLYSKDFLFNHDPIFRKALEQ